MRVAVAGFQPYVNPAITLALGRTTFLDITLRPAELNAQVTVFRTQQPLLPATNSLLD